MAIVAFIPVRGGSKSIPKKNILPIAGKPLVHWTTLAALACPEIDRVYVASDSAEIRAVASRIDNERLSVIDRSPETASDQATTESALLEFARDTEFDKVVLIQATSPLLTAADLSGALAELRTSAADSLLSVTREHRFLWRADEHGFVQASNYSPESRPRRQDWDGELFENGAFYITSREALMASSCRISGKVVAWRMGSETALEIDEPSDLARVESMLAARQAPGDITERAKSIKLLVSDVDGVLTDSGMYYGPQGEVLKKFNTRDGMGMAKWRQHGFQVAIMTSEDTSIVKSRASKLKIDNVFVGVGDKKEELTRFCAQEKVALDEVCFIGDDINDLGVMEIAGLIACPSDAIPEVKSRAHFVCQNAGGRGCVRELIEHLLNLKET